MRFAGHLFLAALVFCVVGRTLGGGKTNRPIDNDFLIKVATCNHAEVEYAKLADKRAGSAKVKDFAANLVGDHKTANDKLAELLKTRKVGVVAGLEKETREKVQRLAKLEGAEFDREFLKSVIQDHKEMIALVDNQVAKGQEADIRRYAKDSLPGLRKHLTTAQELEKGASK